MGLSIHNNVGDLRIGRALESSLDRIDKSNERLSSGKRINRAADDAAGLAIALRMQADSAGLSQGVRNLHDGISVAQVAESGLDQTSQNLTRMRELSVQAQNGSLNADDRALIQQEFDQLAAEVTRVSEATSFNGQALLNGDTSGSGELAIADGGEGDLALSVSDQSAAALGVDGLDVSDPATLGAIDSAIDSVAATRADLGAFTNSASSRIENLRAAHESVEAAKSRILDASIAEETAEKTKHQILFQAEIGLRAQSSLSQHAVLRLLG